MGLQVPQHLVYYMERQRKSVYLSLYLYVNQIWVPEVHQYGETNLRESGTIVLLMI